MDAGIYTNLFQVHWDIQEVAIMRWKRNKSPDLQDIRKQLHDQQVDAQVYALKGDIYGYGQQQMELSRYGFEKKAQRLDQPELVNRLILDGFINSLETAGYTCYFKFGRALALQLNTPLLSMPNGVMLFRGTEITTQFLFDDVTEQVAYFIIIDPVFKYYDQNNHSLSTNEVVAKFGSETLIHLRIKQGDLAPTGGINLEVSRQRLSNFILPFLMARHNFTLPCWPANDTNPIFGIPARIDLNPVRVILAE